jgi:hypothetical protein
VLGYIDTPIGTNLESWGKNRESPHLRPRMQHRHSHTEYTLSAILVIVANMCVPTCSPQDWNRSCGVVAAKNVHVLLGLDASGGPADVPSLRKRSDMEAKNSPKGRIQPALSEQQGIIDTMKHERVQREPG